MRIQVIWIIHSFLANLPPGQSPESSHNTTSFSLSDMSRLFEISSFVTYLDATTACLSAKFSCRWSFKLFDLQVILRTIVAHVKVGRLIVLISSSLVLILNFPCYYKPSTRSPRFILRELNVSPLSMVTLRYLMTFLKGNCLPFMYRSSVCWRFHRFPFL